MPRASPAPLALSLALALLAKASCAQTGAAPGLDPITVEASQPRYVAPTARDRIGRIWAPVSIDGQGPFRLVLDTGASRSAVIERVATALGRTPRADHTVKLRGVTGEAVVPTIHIDTLTVGDLELTGLDVPVVADLFGGADGVLGAEGLADLRIAIEFRRDRIEIRHSSGVSPGGTFSVLPFARSSGRGIVVPALVGSVPTRAIIDTGAQQTVGNLALRERLRRRLREQGATHAGVVGATQDLQQGDGLDVPPIRLGSTETHGVHVLFVDLAIFEHWQYMSEPTILIGMDVLGVLDTLIIDYRRHELALRGTRLESLP